MLAFANIFDMIEFVIPVLDRADTYRTGDVEDIIAVTEGEERIVGIPVTLGEFELRLAFAIGIDGLFLVEINTVRHEFGLNGYAVVMKRVVGVVLADIIRHRVGPFGDRVAMTGFAFGMDNGIAFFGRIGRSADSPKGGSYARLACRA